ncbi:MAG: hypothetical protein RSC29_01030 [Oscillospiraceae bacterium]
MSLTINQVAKNGDIIATITGENSVTLTTKGYNSGDKLVFKSDSPDVWVNVAKDVSECQIFIPNGKFEFPIPEGEAMSGFAPDTFSGEQTVTMRIATSDDLSTYRNLCLNPLDIRLASEVVDPDAPEWSNPTDSDAIKNGEVIAFPHAYANRITRNEGCFYARNAIDGMSVPNGHGIYPYHSWGGAVHEDLTFTVYFGREVELDTLVLALRSDYNKDDNGREHDTFWHTAVIETSDGFKEEIKPQKSQEGQKFDLGKHKTTWIKLQRLDPYQHDGSLNFAALNQLEAWGTICTRP